MVFECCVSQGISAAWNSSGTIAGLELGNFPIGIVVQTQSGTTSICGNRIGTDLVGTGAKPNEIGVLVPIEADTVQIGRACPEGVGGNLISGNSEWGVIAAGASIEIDDNLVGTDESGTAPLPNGPVNPEAFGGGIYVPSQANFVTIGGIDIGALPHNVIAFNRGPGVYVGDDAALTTIRQNSIHSNDGLGIERVPSFVIPEIESVAEITAGTTTVIGALDAAPNTEYDLEFFANEECDPSGFGEGRYFVGSFGDEVETDDTGSAGFTSTLLALTLPAAHFFTATATDASKTVTSEFSNCVASPVTPPPPEEGQQQQQQPPPPPEATPVNGKSVTVVRKSGRVLVKVPGSNKFVPLEGLGAIPIGSIIDATNGRVTLTSVDAKGAEQSGDFYDGQFQVVQQEGGALVTLRLRGGDFSSCKRAGGSRAHAAKRSGRKLWGSGRGRFRTQGNFGSASVRGTVWLTVDQCKGTFFKVRRGVVTVSDFVADKTFSLPTGKGYWAKKQGA